MINNDFYNKRFQLGPFVYRLGQLVFILQRGVRFPQGPPLNMFYYVYMLKSITSGRNKSYVGYTNDIKLRLEKHNSNKGAKSTKGYKWILVFSKRFKTKSEAMSFEYKLKKDKTKRKKILENYSS